MNNTELISLLRAKFKKVKQSNSDWVQIPCPTCTPNDARKMKRGINLRTLYTKCWICEDPITITGLLGRNIEPPENNGIIEEDPEHPQARIIPCSAVTPINQLPHDHPAVQFLHKDHLFDLDRYANEQKIGYITKETAIPVVYQHEDRPDTQVVTENSIVFPVYHQNELVGWQLRFIPGRDKFRYFHIFKKGNYLYNFDNASQCKTVVVTEGVKKALKFPNGVATFGKSISEEQIQKLLNWDNIVFLYDGEYAAQEKAEQLVRELNVGAKRVININPKNYGFDSPDEMPEDVAHQIVYYEWKKQYRD
jgi:hypothetical protein